MMKFNIPQSVVLNYELKRSVVQDALDEGRDDVFVVDGWHGVGANARISKSRAMSTRT